MIAPYYESSGVTIYHADMFDVLPMLAGGSIGALITDPPYSSGGAFRGDRAMRTSEKYGVDYYPDFAGDNRDQRSFLAWSALWMNAARRACVPGAPCGIFTDWRQLPTTSDAVQAGGWTWRGVAVWSKKHGRPNIVGGFSGACEFVVWGTAGPVADAGRHACGVFEQPAFPCAPPRDRVHATQKPEAVMRWVLGITRPEAVILDPFCGSGTTLRAAKDMGRRAIGIEVDERYCEAAAKRMEQESLPLSFGAPAPDIENDEAIDALAFA